MEGTDGEAERRHGARSHRAWTPEQKTAHLTKIRLVDALFERMEQTAREIAALHAQQLRQLAELADLCAISRDADGRIRCEEFTEDELALVMNWTVSSAARHLDLGVELTHRLPATLAALDRGDLDLARARVLAEATKPLTVDLARAVESALLPAATAQNPTKLRYAAAKAVAHADPDGAERRHQARRKDRRVEITPTTEGMAELWALLPAEDATRIKARLDAFAKASPTSDPRTMDQRRADTLADLLLSKSAGRIDTTVHVTIPAHVLAATSPRSAIATDHIPAPGTRPKPRRASNAVRDHDRAASPASRASTADSASRPPSTSHRPQSGRSDQAGPGRTRGRAAPTASGTTADSGTTAANGSPIDRAIASRASSGRSRAPGAPHSAAMDDGSRPTHGSAGDAAVHPIAHSRQSLPANDAMAMLPGYGPITVTQAQRLAATDATWRRLLTDPAGRIVDLGRRRYAPSAELAEFVRARDPYCVFPGCSIPAARCDLDHRVPFPGGGTDAENLAPLCRHHHRLKHESQWTVERRNDGYVWTSPTGTEYSTTPPSATESETKETSAAQQPPTTLAPRASSAAAATDPPPF